MITSHKKTILILITFLVQSLYAQEESIIYRNEKQNESPIPQPYNVSVLILKADGAYEISYQKYHSKRMMKKNILLYTEKEYGSWQKIRDTLILREKNTDQIFKFITKGKKKLSVIIESKEIINSNWKRIN